MGGSGVSVAFFEVELEGVGGWGLDLGFWVQVLGVGV